ncbi:hypothetical protein FISHEDRAFT_49546 [Fistulina hepatica ATCC 64428]|uniref:Amino acid transporter transmembrane domain-containing protein n=1 Tax=Fistulina hepatica ATCC 64428 TaxID=1128425 RepID=A0A0D7A688_9AGAR|nr:hypothetical protein FISHEDRAFT_49546 [Fistulina hepatica ATCC 64428]
MQRGQVFNCTAVLLGIGLLSEPLAFSFTGWILGSLLNLGYGWITCYTAKILARIIIADPHLRSYSDIGRKAFGPKSMPIVSGIFCLELFSVSVVLVTLYADSLHTIIPTYSSDAYKLWGLIILLPSVFLPLSALASFSIVGILSIALLIVVVIYDGLTKREAPGSLWNPADTSFVPGTNTQVGLAFGLLMAGVSSFALVFSGHAVIPSLTMDMADPSQYEKMLNTAFIVATSLYTLIGYAGYIMFGADVHDEISIDLMNTPGYHPVINQVALWLLVLSPLTKFALTTQPLNATIETILGIDHPVLPPEDVAEKPNILAEWKYLGAVVQRIVVTLSSVAVSILVPEFSTVMSFVGAFAAFLLCVIGPLLAKAQLEGAGESWLGRKLGLVDSLLLVGGIVMAVWGTWASLQDVGP